jgi:uncharacterized protein YbjT (DUF2867 family)
MNMSDKEILVVGATGKTGRRVAERLAARGVLTRPVSRSSAIPFDWCDRATWPAALHGVHAAYITYYPDLAVPDAPKDIQAFVDLAVNSGVEHMVLLSGRGEHEAELCENIVREAGTAWTIVRASWFSQNFSEALFGANSCR